MHQPPEPKVEILDDPRYYVGLLIGTLICLLVSVLFLHDAFAPLGITFGILTPAYWSYRTRRKKRNSPSVTRDV